MSNENNWLFRVFLWIIPSYVGITIIKHYMDFHQTTRICPPKDVAIRQDAGHDFAFEMPEEVCKPKPQAEVPQVLETTKKTKNGRSIQVDVVLFGEKMFPLCHTK